MQAQPAQHPTRSAPLCTECAHFSDEVERYPKSNLMPRCNHPGTPRHPITGEAVLLIIDMRSRFSGDSQHKGATAHCGPGAALFQPALSLQHPPTLGSPFHGGAYAGITTGTDGAPYALILLADRPAGELDWQAAMDWAQGLGAALPTRPEAALLFANVRPQLARAWHWTSETYEGDASYAWYCYFYYGYQNSGRKSFEGAAVAVRRLPLESFNPSTPARAARAALEAVDAHAALRTAAQALLDACEQTWPAVAKLGAAA